MQSLKPVETFSHPPTPFPSMFHVEFFSEVYIYTHYFFHFKILQFVPVFDAKT